MGSLETGQSFPDVKHLFRYGAGGSALLLLPLRGQPSSHSLTVRFQRIFLICVFEGLFYLIEKQSDKKTERDRETGEVGRGRESSIHCIMTQIAFSTGAGPG